MCQNNGNNVCADTQTDPLDCGTCGHACNNSQACIAGACACRPGLTQCAGGGNGGCRDLLNDAFNCGACGTFCNLALGQRCVQGACTAVTNGCPNGTTACNGACLSATTLASDPLHCGSCNNACNNDEVCVAGQCSQFFTSQACTTCPCPACGSGTTCCKYPGTMEAICVTGTTCPM
jgi:hypothetical protein